jgi:hypothetical protein
MPPVSIDLALMAFAAVDSGQLLLMRKLRDTQVAFYTVKSGVNGDIQLAINCGANLVLCRIVAIEAILVGYGRIPFGHIE